MIILLLPMNTIVSCRIFAACCFSLLSVLIHLLPSGSMGHLEPRLNTMSRMKPGCRRDIRCHLRSICPSTAPQPSRECGKRPRLCWMQLAGPAGPHRQLFPRAMGLGSGVAVHCAAFRIVCRCQRPKEPYQQGHSCGTHDSVA